MKYNTLEYMGTIITCAGCQNVINNLASSAHAYNTNDKHK